MKIRILAALCALTLSFALWAQNSGNAPTDKSKTDDSKACCCKGMMKGDNAGSEMHSGMKCDHQMASGEKMKCDHQMAGGEKMKCDRMANGKAGCEKCKQMASAKDKQCCKGMCNRKEHDAEPPQPKPGS